MTTRFGPGLEDKSVLALATLLDPRFKKLPFTDHRAVERMTKQIVNDAIILTPSKDDQQQTSETSVSTSTNPVWEALDIQAAESISRRTPAISTLTELDQNFKQPLIAGRKFLLYGGATTLVCSLRTLFVNSGNLSTI